MSRQSGYTIGAPDINKTLLEFGEAKQEKYEYKSPLKHLGEAFGNITDKLAQYGLQQQQIDLAEKAQTAKSIKDQKHLAAAIDLYKGKGDLPADERYKHIVLNGNQISDPKTKELVFNVAKGVDSDLKQKIAIDGLNRIMVGEGDSHSKLENANSYVATNPYIPEPMRLQISNMFKEEYQTEALKNNEEQLQAEKKRVDLVYPHLSEQEKSAKVSGYTRTLRDGKLQQAYALNVEKTHVTKTNDLIDDKIELTEDYIKTDNKFYRQETGLRSLLIDAIEAKKNGRFNKKYQKKFVSDTNAFLNLTISAAANVGDLDGRKSSVQQGERDTIVGSINNLNRLPLIENITRYGRWYRGENVEVGDLENLKNYVSSFGKVREKILGPIVRDKILGSVEALRARNIKTDIYVADRTSQLHDKKGIQTEIRGKYQKDINYRKGVLTGLINKEKDSGLKQGLINSYRELTGTDFDEQDPYRGQYAPQPVKKRSALSFNTDEDHNDEENGGLVGGVGLDDGGPGNGLGAKISNPNSNVEIPVDEMDIASYGSGMFRSDGALPNPSDFKQKFLDNGTVTHLQKLVRPPKEQLQVYSQINQTNEQQANDTFTKALNVGEDDESATKKSIRGRLVDKLRDRQNEGVFGLEVAITKFEKGLSKEERKDYDDLSTKAFITNLKTRETGSYGENLEGFQKLAIHMLVGAAVSGASAGVGGALISSGGKLAKIAKAIGYGGARLPNQASRLSTALGDDVVKGVAGKLGKPVLAVKNWMDSVGGFKFLARVSAESAVSAQLADYGIDLIEGKDPSRSLQQRAKKLGVDGSITAALISALPLAGKFAGGVGRAITPRTQAHGSVNRPRVESARLAVQGTEGGVVKKTAEGLKAFARPGKVRSESLTEGAEHIGRLEQASLYAQEGLDTSAPGFSEVAVDTMQDLMEFSSSVLGHGLDKPVSNLEFIGHLDLSFNDILRTLHKAKRLNPNVEANLIRNTNNFIGKGKNGPLNKVFYSTRQILRDRANALDDSVTGALAFDEIEIFERIAKPSKNPKTLQKQIIKAKKEKLLSALPEGADVEDVKDLLKEFEDSSRLDLYGTVDKQAKSLRRIGEDIHARKGTKFRREKAALQNIREARLNVLRKEGFKKYVGKTLKMDSDWQRFYDIKDGLESYTGGIFKEKGFVSRSNKAVDISKHMNSFFEDNVRAKTTAGETLSFNQLINSLGRFSDEMGNYNSLVNTAESATFMRFIDNIQPNKNVLKDLADETSAIAQRKQGAFAINSLAAQLWSIIDLRRVTRLRNAFSNPSKRKRLLLKFFKKSTNRELDFYDAITKSKNLPKNATKLQKEVYDQIKELGAPKEKAVDTYLYRYLIPLLISKKLHRRISSEEDEAYELESLEDF